MPYQYPWNWQHADWPNFNYDHQQLEAFEAEFLKQAGMFMGAIRHVSDADKEQLTVELIRDEALNTSEIEGETLDRDSLQSSIRRNFGLTTELRKVPPAEQGIAEMMVELYRDFERPLTHDCLFAWHRMLLNGRRDLKKVGAYRNDEQPMQVVSGSIYDPKVHFEAPLSRDVFAEMEKFVEWFNDTAPQGQRPLPILTRAGIAHVYFVTIHPFEDGNGRIGRALVEKVISENLGQATLIALSATINGSRKKYYDALEASNRRLEITPWLTYFSQTLLQAQAHTQKLVDFVIGKSKLMNRLRGQLNDRQEKALLRIMRDGPESFKGGLSADKYIRITGTSRATATRDLQDLVEKKALIRTGELKGTRYWLCLN